MPEKLKVCSCLGPFTSQKTGSTFYVVCAESPNVFGSGWSTIRWKALNEKPLSVGAEFKYKIRTLDTEKGEGQVHVQ